MEREISPEFVDGTGEDDELDCVEEGEVGEDKGGGGGDDWLVSEEEVGVDGVEDELEAEGSEGGGDGVFDDG